MQKNYICLFIYFTKWILLTYILRIIYSFKGLLRLQIFQSVVLANTTFFCGLFFQGGSPFK